MSLLDDVLALDAQFSFTDSDTFGETVVYHNGQSGEARTIIVGVERNPPSPPAKWSKRWPLFPHPRAQ